MRTYTELQHTLLFSYISTTTTIHLQLQPFHEQKTKVPYAYYYTPLLADLSLTHPLIHPVTLTTTQQLTIHLSHPSSSHPQSHLQPLNSLPPSLHTSHIPSSPLINSDSKLHSHHTLIQLSLSSLPKVSLISKKRIPIIVSYQKPSLLSLTLLVHLLNTLCCSFKPFERF